MFLSKFARFVIVLMIMAYALTFAAKLDALKAPYLNFSFHGYNINLVSVLVLSGFLFLCVKLSWSSIRNKRKKRRIINAYKSGPGNLGWEEFEKLVRFAYEKNGYIVNESRSGPDGGVDLYLYKGKEKTIVQCKHYNHQRVGVKVAREMLGVMLAEKADHVVIACSGRFTKEAVKLAKEQDCLTLIDEKALNQML
tara:strand:- start:832 stop:1416 length:585 start_codon:yes stop_codon:yes gene_type:complete